MRFLVLLSILVISSSCSDAEFHSARQQSTNSDLGGTKAEPAKEADLQLPESGNKLDSGKDSVDELLTGAAIVDKKDSTPSPVEIAKDSPSDETPSDETPSDETPSDETPSDGADTGSTESGDTSPTVTQDQLLAQGKCYFAVSGGYIGLKNVYGYMTYPNEKDGKPIYSGAKFDSAGGVFLAARKKAYVYGADGPDGGITMAVSSTFDAIIIAPDMEAVIRDVLGNIVLPKTAGPAYIWSSEYGSTYKAKTLSDLKALPDLPSWLRTILPATWDQVPARPLHKSYSVKVTPVAGGPCDVPN